MTDRLQIDRQFDRQNVGWLAGSLYANPTMLQQFLWFWVRFFGVRVGLSVKVRACVTVRVG